MRLSSWVGLIEHWENSSVMYYHSSTTVSLNGVRSAFISRKKRKRKGERGKGWNYLVFFSGSSFEISDKVGDLYSIF